MKTKHIQKFVNLLVSGQVTLHHSEELTHTPFYQKGTKNKLNLLMKELQRNEKVFEAIQGEAESATDDVHDSFYNFMNMVTSVPFHESGNAAKVLEAYQIDQKRMEQITKKIFEDEKRRFKNR